MKQFFEQYGGVALGILALLVLIAMIIPVGNIIKTSLQGTVHKFSSSINAQTDDMSNQMTTIMNIAGDFLNIKSDGKMYKGDILYTGWDGNKAYLNGEENPIIENCEMEFYWILNPYVPLRTDDSFRAAGLNPDEFEVIYFKLNDNLMFEHSKGEDFSGGLAFSSGVSTYELVVKTPSNFMVSTYHIESVSNYKSEVIEDDGHIKLTKISATIDYIPNYKDIYSDDLFIRHN